MKALLVLGTRRIGFPTKRAHDTAGAAVPHAILWSYFVVESPLGF
jgi:hypothetical protein